jgi:hypothetical protein
LRPIIGIVRLPERKSARADFHSRNQADSDELSVQFIAIGAIRKLNHMLLAEYATEVL